MTDYTRKNELRRKPAYKAARQARTLRQACGGAFGKLPARLFNAYAEGTSGHAAES